MTEIIRHAEAITRHRDHSLVDIALVSSLVDLLGWGRRIPAILMYRITHVGGERQVAQTAWNEGRSVCHDERELEPEAIPAQLLEAIGNEVMTSLDAQEADGTTTHYCWMPVVRDGLPLACLEFRLRRALNQRQLRLIDGMRGLYCNYLSLLHYSQVDSLTGLLNRKTFDDSLHKLLAAADGPAQAGGPERRSEDSVGEHWLAVLDLDRFKRVNDSHGHLFGDQVLVGLANIMRQVFRRRDKLFRFGGEEFVVILRHTSEKNALKVFERLRATVEAHPFPVVGTVTISIGLTRVHAHDSPTILLGRADDALYYAKKHGRNRLCYHEALVAKGRLKPAQP